MSNEISTKIKTTEETLAAVNASARRCTIGRTVVRGTLRGFYGTDSSGSPELVTLAISELKNSAGILKECTRVFVRAVDELASHVERESVSNDKANGKEANRAESTDGLEEVTHG